MREEHWQKFREAALGQNREFSVALIVDSPWIPTLMGISHLEYYLFFDKWLEANLYLQERFPWTIFVPGFWVEYGMAIEPSAFGCKISWSERSTPNVHPVLDDIEDVQGLPIPNPRTDGLMPLALQLYRRVAEQLSDSGFKVRMVAARGPLTIATWLRGVTRFMVDIKRSPELVHKLLEVTTQATIDWLEAQSEVVGGGEGILVLDDLVGFLSPQDYERFAHSNLEKIFRAFEGLIRVFHCDMNTRHLLDRIADLDFEVFNFSHQMDMAETLAVVRGRKCLMGNVPPLEVLARSDPETVRRSVSELLSKLDDVRGVIISAGGGVAPGTPAENIVALVDTVAKWNKRSFSGGS